MLPRLAVSTRKRLIDSGARARGQKGTKNMAAKRKRERQGGTQRRKQGSKVRLEDLVDMYENCAGIDVHKSSLTACAICGKAGEAVEGEMVDYGTTTPELREFSQWLKNKGVTHIVMESTGVYWRPVWQILEQEKFELLLANAKEVRNMPGRKTDSADAIWLATLLRKGLIKGSFIAPAEIRVLRDLCRSRSSLVQDRTRVVQRIERVLETANIKLDTVVSDLMGASARRMLDGLAAGETDTTKLAEMALGRLRPKIPQLVGALEGSFRPHQLFLLQELLEHFDTISARIERFEREIQECARPFEEQIQRLDQIPGLDRLAASSIIAETGVDMSHFPTAGQFCRWGRISPGNNESAGNKRGGKIGKGNQWLRAMLVQCAWAATHDKKSYFSAQYRRLLHRDKQRALVGVAHSMMAVIWHMLKRGEDYQDLGPDYFEKQNLEGQKRACLNKLRKLGFEVTLQPAA